ncbi:MAG: TatD family hydrolase [Bacteroidales bacterium]|nr:TatD family hydrolase [Bacteroidales bacterium]
MNLIDTHTHLYLSAFDNDREQVIKSALNDGVRKFLLPNIDNSTVLPMLKLTGQFPEACFPMMGLHPTSVKADYNKKLIMVANWLPKEPFCAIGEIGIDLYWDKQFLQEQIRAFRYQIELALKHNLPVVIHSRQSFEVIIDVLKEFKDQQLRGVFHSFTGSLEQAYKAIELGFKLGIGGVVTFTNSGLDKVVEKISLEHIVLETDSPYLAPAPRRGKRNESAYLLYIANKLAGIFSTDIEKVADITSANAIKLFRI